MKFTATKVKVHDLIEKNINGDYCLHDKIICLQTYIFSSKKHHVMMTIHITLQNNENINIHIHGCIVKNS